MDDLSWKTEDEIELPASLGTGSAKSKKRRRLALSLTIICILLASAIIYIRLSLITARDRSQVDIDVRAAFLTWREAVEETDAEILKSIVAGDEPAWFSNQMQHIEEGTLFDHPGLGFILNSDTEITENPHYELSNDWRSVSFYFTTNYFDPASFGDAKSFDLEHSVTFRREGSRWLYGQPSEQFWGDVANEEFESLKASFPEKDRGTVLQLARDLDNDLRELCLEKTGSVCRGSNQTELIFDKTPALLYQYDSPGAVVFQDEAFLLPTPSLIGKPVDQTGYKVMYDFYSSIVLRVIGADLASPIAEPDQTVQLLCYEEFGRRPKLFRYDPAGDRWDVLLPDRSFRYLTSLPGDEGLLLQQFESDGSRRWISLISVIDGQVEELYDYLSGNLQVFPIEQPLSTSGQNILLIDHSSQTSRSVFRLLNGSGCIKRGCEFGELDGFPAWSPDGRISLLWQDGMLALGDKQGQRIREIAEGFNPFWLDNEHYGYAQFGQNEAQPGTTLYMGTLNQESDTVLLTSQELSAELENGSDDPIFIHDVVVNPRDPSNLIIIGRDYASEPYNNYIFDVNLSIDTPVIAIEQISLLGTFQGKVSAIPAATSPIGKVPILFSPDGNMVTVSRFDDSDQTWEIDVIDLSTRNTHRYFSRYPAYTFTYPYYDWSSNSDWLAIVDEGFLHLTAPRYDFERLIPNNNQICSQVAWVNN